MTRKILAAGIAALALSSCSTITHTSQTAAVDTQVYNLTVADMKVAAKKDSVTVDWKWNPLSTISLSAQKETATHTLLGKSDADVLVEPEYIVKRRGLFRGGSVTVTGYPATYSNFRAMTAEDAEKIATVNGDNNIVVVNPILSTTAGKVVKKKKPAPVLPLRKREAVHYQFVNVLGGAVIDVNGTIDVGYHFGAMYGSYGKSWGWYGKVVLNSAELYQYEPDSDSDYKRKWSPSITLGAIKTLGSGFSTFFGIGAGGYFVEDEKEYYTGGYWDTHYEEVTKFSIPVEIGFMKRFNSVNVMLGATYATPVAGIGSGNINPFVGVGYSF